MPDTLTREIFAHHLNEPFYLHVDTTHVVPFQLIEVTALSVRPIPSETPWTPDQVPGRESFALIFRGPHAPALPQQLYQIEHAAIGTCAIFIVPIGENRSGRYYEAVFN